MKKIWRMSELLLTLFVTAILFARFMGVSAEAASVITAQPRDCYATIGDTTDFSVLAQGENLSFSWYISKDNGVNWGLCSYNGSTTGKLAFKVEKYQYGYKFRCVIKDKSGNTYTSNTVTLLEAEPAIAVQPVNTAADTGDKVSFTVKTVGNKVTYTWYFSADGGITWNKCNGYTRTEKDGSKAVVEYEGIKTDTLSFTASEEHYGYLFQCHVITSAKGVINSNNVKLKRKSFAINEQPENISAYVGDKAVFSVDVGGTVKSYQWYYSKNGKKWSKCKYASAKSAVLEVPVKQSLIGYSFKCVIKDKSGKKLTTEPAVLKSRPSAITLQPEPVSAGVGDKITFSCKAAGGGLSYRWYYSADNGKTWKALTTKSAKTEKLSFKLKKKHLSYTFKCVVKDSSGERLESNYVWVCPPNSEYRFVNLEQKSYKAAAAGVDQYTAAVSSSDFAKGLSVSEDGKVILTYTGSTPVQSGDVLILHFRGYAYNYCGEIKVSINSGAFTGTYPIPVTETEFAIPFSGLTEIKKITLEYSGTAQRLCFNNFEVINCGKTDVSMVQTGEFTVDKNYKKTNIEEFSGKGYAGFELVTDGRYLYELAKGELLIYSLSDPSAPELTGRLDGIGNAREIAFCGNGTLAISARESGAYFVDVSNPSKPEILSHISAQGLPTGIAVEGNYCFVCCRRFGVEIYDISDIRNPKYCTIIYGNGEELYDCCVADGFLYVTSWAEKHVRVYDLEDVCNPKFASMFYIHGQAAGCVARDGVLYIATGYNSKDSTSSLTSSGYGWGNGLDIYDVSDPYNPSWLSTTKIDGRYQMSGFDHWSVDLAGDYAYLTSAYCGLTIIDVSRPEAPVKVENVYLDIPSTSPNFKVTAPNNKYLFPYDYTEVAREIVTSVAITDGWYYISANGGLSWHSGDDRRLKNVKGMYAVKSSAAVLEHSASGKLKGTTAKHELVDAAYGTKTLKQYFTGSTIWAVAQHGGYYYCASAERGIEKYDSSFNLKASYRTKGNARDIKIVGDYCLVAEESAGLGIYSISGGMKEVGRCDYSKSKISTFTNLSVMSDNKHVIAQIGWTIYGIIDISDMTKPVVTEAIYTGTMYDRNLLGYTTWPCSLNCVFDKRNITWYAIKNGKPEIVKQLSNSKFSEQNGITYVNGKALIVTGNGYVIFDPLTVTQEQFNSLSVIKAEGAEMKGNPTVFENILVLNNTYGRQLTFVDITDINHPVLLHQLDLDCSPDGLYLDGSTLLVPFRRGGILVMK